MNWKTKLSSRKFWLAIVAFVSSILIAMNSTPESIEKITAIIMSGGALIAYILGESYIDGKREEGDFIIEEMIEVKESEFN